MQLVILLTSLLMLVEAIEHPISDLPATNDEAYTLMHCYEPLESSERDFISDALVLNIHRIKLFEKDRKRRDIIVLTCPNTTELQQERFKKAGAIVVPVGIIKTGTSYNDLFKNVNTKFHLWRLLQWKRIVYLDVDLFLRESFLDIWDDRATRMQYVYNSKDKKSMIKFIFAAARDPCFLADWCLRHWPHTAKNYFNTGLMVLTPSMEIYKHILRTLEKHQERLEFPDQDLLNLAFARTSTYPWIELKMKYNSMIERVDITDDIAGIHGKLWKGDNDLSKMWFATYAEMENKKHNI